MDILSLTFDSNEFRGIYTFRYCLGQITFEFKIHGKGTGMFGDGMAMWITKERAQTGTVFGFKDQFEGLGVFIDTYKNGRAGVSFPYVMAMLGDGRTSYDAENDGKANDIGGCSVIILRDVVNGRPVD